MTTHVALLASDAIYDGYGLKKEIYDWLQANVGAMARDMTELQWTSKAWLMAKTRSPHNPKYHIPSARSSIMAEELLMPLYLHFQFYRADKAMMFKLAWGGECHS